MPRKLAIPALAAALLLGGCARFGATTVEDTVPSPPPPEHRSTVLYESSGGQPAGPAKTKATDLVGRWGFASYHRPEDRDRTLAAAEKTCDHPYLIGEGRSGGVVMHLADQSEPVELTLKGSTEGHDFLGPEGPAGGETDRRILSFDGRTLTMDFVNDEIGGRYGTQIYVRCSAVEEEAKTNIRKPAAGPATAKPKAAPNPKKTAAKSPDKPKGKAVGQKTDVTGGVRTAPPPTA